MSSYTEVNAAILIPAVPQQNHITPDRNFTCTAVSNRHGAATLCEGTTAGHCAADEKDVDVFVPYPKRRPIHRANGERNCTPGLMFVLAGRIKVMT